MSDEPVERPSGAPTPAGKRTVSAFVAILLIALTTAALGAGLGGWLGWHGAPPLPDDSTAAMLARSVVPRGTPLIVEKHDVLFGYDQPGTGARLLGASGYSGGYIKFLITDGDPAPEQLTEIRGLLLLDRWRISSDLVGAGMVGTKDRLSVRVYPANTDGDRLTDAEPDDSVVIEIGRSEPARVQTFTVLGYLLLGVLGWLGGAFVVGRLYQDGAVRRRTAAAGGALSLLLLLPGTVLTTGQLIYVLLLIPDSMPAPPSWGQYLLPGVRALTILGLLVAVAALAATLPSEPRSRYEGS